MSEGERRINYQRWNDAEFQRSSLRQIGMRNEDAVINLTTGLKKMAKADSNCRRIYFINPNRIK